MLNEMDGIEGRKHVIVMGATNRPDIIDKALMRPGRLDKLMYIPPPDYEGRLDILKITTEKMPLASEVELESIAKKTEMFSGAEVALVSREAGMIALAREEDEPFVTMLDLEKAVAGITPQLSKLSLAHFEHFNKK